MIIGIKGVFIVVFGVWEEGKGEPVFLAFRSTVNLGTIQVTAYEQMLYLELNQKVVLNTSSS